MKTYSRIFLITLFITLSFLIPSLIFAAPASTHSTVSNTIDSITRDQGFDPTLANKSFNLLKTQTNNTKISVKELQIAIAALNKFQYQAKKCVDTNTALLDKLNQRLDEIDVSSPTDKQAEVLALTEEQKYLNTKKEELSSQLSECRLFSLRAEELIGGLTQKLRRLVTNYLLYAHPNVFENIKNAPTDLYNSWESFDRQVFSDESGISFFLDRNISLLVLPLFVLVAVFYSNNRVKKKIIPLIEDSKNVGFSLHLKQALIAIVRRYSPAFAGTAALAIFFSIFTHSLVTPSYLALTSYAFLAYLIYLSLVRLYFYPPHPAIGFTSLPQSIAKIMAKRLTRIGMLGLIIYIIYISLNTQEIDTSITHLFHTTAITLFAISFISILWAVKDFPTLNYQNAALSLLSRILLSAFLLCVLITECLGYHLLASYLLSGATMTLLLIFCTKCLDKLVSNLLNIFKGTTYPWQQKFRNSFGLKRNEQLLEILWLRMLLYVILWLGFVIAILKIWGVTQLYFQQFMSHLFHGFDIGKLHISPSHIIAGILFFIIFSLATRWFRAHVIKNASWQLGISGRESLASIIGYLGFAIAFILGALIAGVNFSGLALIATALAFGIGLGLQDISKNFVSGFVLLIQRPIKLGDRIVIGQTEGYVKKISILSTHISTPRLTDVIVPNSELITQQVVNYMLHDTNYKISVIVGIAYHSDVTLAKNILLSLAKTHPQIVSDRKDMEPIVYFKEFAESHLTFELFCMIKDIGLRFETISDLNFAIDQAFREKGIEIAHPQREIRIKSWPQGTPPQPSSSE